MSPYDPPSGLPSPAPVGFGPPAGYDPTFMAAGPGMHLQGLEKEGTTWLIVAIAGFLLGFFWITGPIAWWGGAKLRRQYRELGMEPASNANVAWVLGIVSTVFGALVLLAVVAGIAVFVYAASTHPGVFAPH